MRISGTKRMMTGKHSQRNCTHASSGDPVSVSNRFPRTSFRKKKLTMRSTHSSNSWKVNSLLFNFGCEGTVVFLKRILRAGGRERIRNTSKAGSILVYFFRDENKFLPAFMD